MQVHPSLAGLRSTGAAQPRTDAALAEWRAHGPVAAVLAEFEAYGTGAPLDTLPALARLFADLEAAQAFADAFIAPLTGVLAAEPLAELPFGSTTLPALARLRLAAHGRAVLAFGVYAPRPEAQPASALFEDGAAHEMVLAGTGRAARFRWHGGVLERELLDCCPGIRIACEGPDEARQIIAVSRPLLVLQLARTAAQPGPSQERAVPDGALLKTISGSKRASGQMMALGVLGALGHRPALNVMERLALDQQAERDLRWEALRQTLAMDTARGIALLARLAARSDEGLAASAARLHRDLLASHPGLVTMEPA